METKQDQVCTGIPEIKYYSFYLHDVVTVLLKNEKNSEHPAKAKPNFAVDSLDNLISLLQSTFTVESEE